MSTIVSTQTAVLTVRELGEVDSLANASATSVSDLMQQAGQAVAREIMRRWNARAVVVLCGPGNNGGDGFVAAQCLANAGWPVRLALLGSREALTGAAAVHAQRWSGAIEQLAPAALMGAELVVDAIFGAGLSRRIDSMAAATLVAAVHNKLPIVAIDVPSGVVGDTGEDLGAVAAVVTITFFRKKPGHLLTPGKFLCGEVVVASIGITDDVLTQVIPQTFENAPACWAHALPRLQQSGNKYTRGHALISGGYPQTGAARLAARAAARIGAGLITIAVPEIALPIYASALTSIMVHPLSAHEDFNHLLDDPRFSAVLIGPGAGINEQTRARVLAMLGSGRPVVLDADALTAFAGNPAELDWAIDGARDTMVRNLRTAEKNRAIVSPGCRAKPRSNSEQPGRDDDEPLVPARPGCVLTPHDGEFLRLFDSTGDKLTRARAAARRSGAIIILKGSDTVIASPDGRAIINSNAPPTLATAGSGDVLSGLVLGLLTQGMEPFLAAAAAVWIHGAAAMAFGPGLMSEDVPELVPGVLHRLSSSLLPLTSGQQSGCSASNRFSW